MVVPDGRAQEVVCKSRSRHDYLCAAKIVIVLIFNDIDLFQKHFGAVWRDFQYPCLACRYDAMHGDSYPGFEMSVIAVTAYDVEWYRAMGEQQFVSVNA